jgi:hypothetical protein
LGEELQNKIKVAWSIPERNPGEGRDGNIGRLNGAWSIYTREGRIIMTAKAPAVSKMMVPPT